MIALPTHARRAGPTRLCYKSQLELERTGSEPCRYEHDGLRAFDSLRRCRGQQIVRNRAPEFTRSRGGEHSNSCVRAIHFSLVQGDSARNGISRWKSKTSGMQAAKDTPGNGSYSPRSHSRDGAHSISSRLECARTIQEGNP